MLLTGVMPQLCASESLLQESPTRDIRIRMLDWNNRETIRETVCRPRAALLPVSIAFPREYGYNTGSSIAAGAPLQGFRRGSCCFHGSHANDRQK
jgi:hypothetical protein